MNDQILRKIKRCFELSKSSNEHEAALAIKQMQALMQKHNLNEQHILAADVKEHLFELNVRKPADWVLQLHNTISQALDCESIIRGGGEWEADLVFVGVGSAPEVAAYAFEVLFRQLKQNRADFIKTQLFRFKRSNKTKFADAYCMGWVRNVYSKVKNLNPNIEVKNKINAYYQTQFNNWDPEKVFEGNKRYKEEDSTAQTAMLLGYREAKEVNLFVATEHAEKVQIGGAYE